MGWFDSSSDESSSYDQYVSAPVLPSQRLYSSRLSLRYNSLPHEHKAKVSHELLGGAAAFEAAKAWEDHCAANGKPESHAKAKEFLAGIVGAFIEREAETKGLNFVDKERAKHHAKKVLEEQVAQEYTERLV
ncbi:hypothetical protein EW145_g7621 [Phellinidium pouzarii]|uniref:CipC-like antibiotic response protein n=1 Tax=Phellinidium pouzarii TaxID=167371 RepID=A0A4S4KHF8_9AGAM|nr:hypothetical protein EW145_g7621 [Phellinidium pouzarii]